MGLLIDHNQRKRQINQQYQAIIFVLPNFQNLRRNSVLGANWINRNGVS